MKGPEIKLVNIQTASHVVQVDKSFIGRKGNITGVDWEVIRLIMKKHIPRGSDICWDTAKVYHCLCLQGFTHQNVCYKREFKAADGLNTNAIGNVRLNLKAVIKAMRGTNVEMLALYIYEFRYRFIRRSDGDI